MKLNAETSYLEAYYQLAACGDIIIGREMRTELEKLREDLFAERYVYDTSEVRRRVAFQSKYCLQTKKPFANKPLVLLPWQKAWWDAVYSFKVPETMLRRFTRGIQLVARKNGKSTEFAGDGMCDLFIGDEGSDIAAASVDDKTAKFIWQEIANMRGKLDTKNRMTSKTLTVLRNDKRFINIFRVSAKSENLDGLNLDKVFLDEAHQAKNDELYEALWHAQAAKDEPFLFLITTEGFLDGMFLDQRLDYARKVLNNEIDDEAFLPWLYTQDSEAEIWQDPSSWQKANPSLIYGVKKQKFLEENVKLAASSAADRIHTLVKDFNYKQNKSSAWLRSEYVDFESPFDLDDFRKGWALIGADLSETTDLSAIVVFLMRPGDPKKYIYSHFFIPEDKLENSPDINDGAKYRDWIREGYITLMPGAENNVAEMVDWLYENVLKPHGIRAFQNGYDNRYAKDYIKRCDDYGYDSEMVLQKRHVLNMPMRLVESELRSRNLYIGNNPVMRWCLRNTGIDVDDYGKCMPCKISTGARIDGAAALINAYEMYRRYRTDFDKLIARMEVKK